jgi:hypothetical protein
MGPYAKALATVACALTLAMHSARAEEACRADAERLCKGVRPGGGRILRCLKSHEAELSPACRTQLGAAREKAATFAEACKADARRLCAGVAPGGGRVLACLRSHQAELSPGCRGALSK